MPDKAAITILNVDDDEAGRYIVSTMLKHAGFMVKEAASGAECLRLAQEQPHLIILDVQLPDIDGFEVCRQLKTTAATATIPVLHLSATHRTVDKRVQGLENGADGYLTQPADEEELIATVRALLRIRQAEDDRRRLEAQVLQAQKWESLGVMAGGIAHDFNNLLMVILGHVDLLKAKAAAQALEQPSVQQIEKAALRAAELTRQMLEYSGRGRFIVRPLNLSALVEESSALLAANLGPATGISFELARGLPDIQADSGQLQQAMLYLLTNAVEAGDPAAAAVTLTTGLIEVTPDYLETCVHRDAAQAGLHVYLEVADKGSGIAPAVMERIFDPFFSTKFTGRGLGLGAVLGIVRGHQGAIRLESTPGLGTTIRLLIPVLPRPALAAPAQPAPAGPPAAAEPRAGKARSSASTILVVDDEATVLTVTRLILEAGGFNVVTAGGGREGVERLRASAPEISAVLLDMTMPMVGGYEAFVEMRRIKPDLQVILCSGYIEEQATDRFAGQGLAGFIQKPYRVQALLEKMSEVTRQAVAVPQP